MKKTVISLAAILMLLTAACQPTPEVEPVPNKGDAVAETVIHETKDNRTAENDGEALLQADMWVDEIKTQDWTVPIRAEVITSGQETFPVRVVQEKMFSAAEAERLANLFFPDVSAVMEGNRYTVSEYEQSIRNRTEQGRLDSAKQYAEELQSEEVRQNAYRQASMITLDTILPDALPQQIRVQAKEKNGTVWASSRSIELQEAAFGNIYWKELVEEEGVYDGDTPRAVCPGISSEAAIQAAEAFLKQADIEGFSPVSFREVLFRDMFYSEDISIGWSIEFVKAYEYYPFNTALGNSGPLFCSMRPESKPWENEMITFYVSEQGKVQLFRWENPTEVLSVANENVRLMPLNEAETIMKRLIAYGLPVKQIYQGNPIPFSYTLKVTKLYLSVSLQSVKDDISKAYVMPTWICCVEVFDLDMETGRIREPSVDSCYYGFNAIDGTYVELRKVYRIEDMTDE